MLPWHLLTRNVDWRRVERLGTWAVVVILAIICWLQFVAMKKMDIVYSNPRKVEKVRVVRLAGATRTVTKIVEREGVKETTVEETRGPIFETMDRAFLVEPVFPPAPRANRWLAGATLDPLRPRERASWSAYGGYSWGNRVDLALGAPLRGRGGRLLFMLRF
jgi:hypothetical protein